jgi:hypothetical protein
MRTQNFHEGLERDLERLTSDLRSVKEKPEARELSEREIVSRTLRSFRDTLPPREAEEQVSQKQSSEKTSDSFLPSYLVKDEKAERAKARVENLIKLVFREGLEKAMKEARRESPFVEDAFHDALVDKLLPELKRRKAL